MNLELKPLRLVPVELNVCGALGWRGGLGEMFPAGATQYAYNKVGPQNLIL